MAKTSEKALAAIHTAMTADPVTGQVSTVPTPRLKRQVTRPLLKQRVGQEVWVKFVGKIFQSEKITTGKAAEDAKLPPMMAFVLDLFGGGVGEYQYIIPAVLRSELERAYPNGSYEGLCFHIQKLGPDKEAGKLYNNFRIVETFDPADEDGHMQDGAA